MILSEDNVKIAVIGGDERQVHCAIYFADLGYETALFGFDKYEGDVGLCTKASSLFGALSNSSIIIMPMNVGAETSHVFSPLSSEKITYQSVVDTAHERAAVFGGKISAEIKKVFDDKGLKVFDYFEREELVVANAYLTAESAVEIVLGSIKESISDSSVLVMGYGRIGKMLCHILKGMGADVYASARNRKDFEWIRAFGYSPVDTSKVCDVVAKCSVIFNTIPNLVLAEKELYCLPKDCYIIDLASKPGGIDFDAAKRLGLRVNWALALPGKCKPVSAGKAVAKTILNIIEDEVIDS